MKDIRFIYRLGYESFNMGTFCTRVFDCPKEYTSNVARQLRKRGIKALRRHKYSTYKYRQAEVQIGDRMYLRATRFGRWINYHNRNYDWKNNNE